MAISGHRFEASLGITPDALLVSNEKFALIWYPTDAWKATWVTAAEFYSAVIPSNLHVLVNSAVAIHTTHVLRSLFLWKLRVFMNPNSAGSHWTFHFQIICLRQKKTKKKKKLQEKVLNWTCETNSVCKLLQIVNFDGYWTLMVWNFWQDSSYSTNQIIEPFLQVSWYTYWSVLYESIEHTDDTDYWTLFTSILIYLLERALWEYRAYWWHW